MAPDHSQKGDTGRGPQRWKEAASGVPVQARDSRLSAPWQQVSGVGSRWRSRKAGGRACPLVTEQDPQNTGTPLSRGPRPSLTTGFLGLLGFLGQRLGSHLSPLRSDERSWAQIRTSQVTRPVGGRSGVPPGRPQPCSPSFLRTHAHSHPACPSRPPDPRLLQHLQAPSTTDRT